MTDNPTPPVSTPPAPEPDGIGSFQDENALEEEAD